MRFEEKEDGSLEIWFSMTELTFEGGAQYKLLSHEQVRETYRVLYQLTCDHSTWFDNEEGTRASCNDCGFEWNLEVPATQDADQQQDDGDDDSNLQGKDEEAPEGQGQQD